MFLARALQGIGSSCSSVSGLLKIIVIIVIIFNVTTTIITPFMVFMTRDGNVGRALSRRQGARERYGTCPWRPRSWCRYRYFITVTIVIIISNIILTNVRIERITTIFPGPPFGGFMYQFVGKTGALKLSSSCSSPSSDDHQHHHRVHHQHHHHVHHCDDFQRRSWFLLSSPSLTDASSSSFSR